jgi:2-polyprenyl-3-methyl-5-hydroxy-6-metoxy-1,4-benzoquinol methylase
MCYTFKSNSNFYDTFNYYVYKQIPFGKKILDVGCGTGLLGKILRSEGKVSYIVGIEKDKYMAEIARPNYDMIVNTDIENVSNLPLNKSFFDVIIFSDILEHLKKPLEVLINFTQYLSEDGFFLISVPNIAFISIRLSLLFGNFDYSLQGGILDENHLQFFTRKSLKGLLNSAKLKIEYLRGYNQVKKKYFLLKILGFILPNLFSIQFLAKAKRTPSFD